MNQDNGQANIVFEGEETQQPHPFQTPTPKIIRWMMEYSGGLVKDENQADYVLIGFVVVAIVVSLFLFFGGSSNKTIPFKPAAGSGY